MYRFGGIFPGLCPLPRINIYLVIINHNKTVANLDQA